MRIDTNMSNDMHEPSCDTHKLYILWLGLVDYLIFLFSIVLFTIVLFQHNLVI